MRYSTLGAAVLTVAIMLITGCTEVVVSSGAKFETSSSSGGTFNPNKVPRLVTLTPNSGPEGSSTDFVIEGVNLLPLASVTVDFGTQQFSGTVNPNGNQITSTSSPSGMFTAPPGTGTVDVVCTINGQNPPSLSLPNAFIYLPPTAPAPPKVNSQSPDTDTEFGGTTMTMTGTDVPMSAGYNIVVSWLFSSGTVNVAAAQTADNSWDAIIPPVPQAENFQSGTTLDVTVTVTFTGGGLPAPIVEATPTGPVDSNPFTYTHTGTPPAPVPEEYVVASGLSAPNSQNTPDSFVRTIQTYDPVYDTLTTVQGLTSRYMFNGSMATALSGTHEYPKPISTDSVSWREANSTFSHFVLPQFDRTYVPAVPAGQAPPAPVTKPVTAKLYHCTNTESSVNITGGDDGFFAVYSQGEVEVFNVGGANIHEEIAIHEDFLNFPYFACCFDGSTERIFVCRMDGVEWTASTANSNEINLTNITGAIIPNTLQLAGDHLYFATDAGEVYHSPVDSGSQGVNPIAVAMNWPSGAVHGYVADEFNISGDGNTICFVAGTGDARYTQAGQNPPDTHNVFAIRNAASGNNNITEVTDFASPGKQIQIWNIDNGPSSTYGNENIDNGANDRRVYMAGVNAFSSSTNRPGSDVIVNYDGELCAFVTREDRNVVDGTTPAFVVYYLYVARIGQGTNQCKRINSYTTGEFGIGQVFDSDMTVVPGFYFPKKVPNNGMKYRLVFTIATVAGAGVLGEDQHLYTADIALTTGGLGNISISDRTEQGVPQPFNVTSTSRHYFGGFQSRGGHVFFIIEVNSGKLQYVDLRDGVSSLVADIERAHDGQSLTLPVNSTASAQNENTYLPPGFAPDPAGSVGLEHWGNQIQSLQGPGLNGSTIEYLLFPAEENAGEEEVYLLRMNGLSSPLPSQAVNVSNIGGTGVIKGIFPSQDGGVLAIVKGTDGFPEGYRYSGTVEGSLYIVNDLPGYLAANAGSLQNSATEMTSLVGNKFSRSMRWYEDPDRYSLYFGEGSTVGGSSGNPPPRSFLRFTRIDVDRTAGNNIDAEVAIDTIDGTQLDDGAVYIYDVGKLE